MPLRQDARTQLDQGIAAAQLRVPPATYTPHWHQSLKGNPFAEALQPLQSRESMMQSLSVLPPYDPTIRKAEPEIRLFHADATPAFLQPLTRHYELKRTLVTNLHMGYADRNPLEPTFSTDVTNLANGVAAAIEQPPARLRYSGPASALLLIGNSGMGKTTSIRHILDSIPHAVAHSSYAGQTLTTYQLVHLYVETPSDASTKGLATEVFNAVDATLGTDLRNLYLRGSGTARDHAGDMAAILGHLGLGLLVIDEIQNLNVARSGGEVKVLNFLTYLTNHLNVPIVLIGTPDAERFLFKKFRLIRRTTGQGVTEWHNLTGNEFSLFLESLWTYQYTATETPLTKEHEDAMYQESQGNIDVAIKIYRQAQQLAIEKRSRHGQQAEIITPGLIRTAARKRLGALSTPVRFLRQRNSEQVHRYGDLTMNPLSTPTQSPTPRTEVPTAKPSAPSAADGAPKRSDLGEDLPPTRAGTDSLPRTNPLLELSRLPEADRKTNYARLKELGVILPIEDMLRGSIS